MRYLWEDFLPDCTAVVFMVCAAYERIVPMRTKLFRLQDASLQVDSADEERIEEAQQVCNKKILKK